MKPKVLDVGQCTPDHTAIAGLLKNEFDADVEQAHTAADAMQQTQYTRFALILINRILDQDGSPGMAILASLKSSPATSDVPVMIVSNFEDTQTTAVLAGAVPGFGKSALNATTTKQLLSTYLSPT